mgnify:CR=1 FL=1
MASYDQPEDRQGGYSLMGTKEKAARPALDWRQVNDGYVLRIFGDWQVSHVRRIAKEIKKLKCGTAGAGPKDLTVDMAGLSGLDTAGAMLILDMNELLKSKGFVPHIINAREAD